MFNAFAAFLPWLLLGLAVSLLLCLLDLAGRLAGWIKRRAAFRAAVRGSGARFYGAAVAYNRKF